MYEFKKRNERSFSTFNIQQGEAEYSKDNAIFPSVSNKLSGASLFTSSAVLSSLTPIPSQLAKVDSESEESVINV
jgi:hypothetical protein